MSASSDPLAEIKVTFFQECDEQLGELEAGLLSLQRGEGDHETVNAIFRAVHSIKGGAGAFGLETLVHFSHVFENVLDNLRSEKLAIESALLATLLRAVDMLADHVNAARDGGEVDRSASEAIVDQLTAICSAEEAGDEVDFADFAFEPVQVADINAPAQDIKAWTITFQPKPGLYASANDVVLLLRELQRLGDTSIELDTSAVPPIEDLDPEGAYLAWTIGLKTAESETVIREVFEFVEDVCALTVRCEDQSMEDISALLARLSAEMAVAPEQVTHDAAPFEAALKTPSEALKVEPAGPSVPTIRVDLDRVDRLIDLVGELVINQAMLAQRVLESGAAKTSNITIGLEELEHLTRDIQDSVMAIRAQPVKSVLQRLPRLVREVALAVGKQVNLVTEGENTEVDKTIIEKLADPLTHMVRNAIDHGLETPEDRVAAGKSPEGIVRVAAKHRSGRIMIEVSDDGQGINRVAVRAKAIDRGLIAADAILSDEEIDNLIFSPGFSTAATVSDISGRGVGMDVVKRSIQALGGRISITSRPGEGSTFTMSLPLTLAVLDGMVVTVAGQTFVAPLSAIIETLQPRLSDLRMLGATGQLLTVRQSYVPLVDVGAALGYPARTASAADGVVLLVEGDDGDRTALLVDDIIGQRQVVIKSLEANYRHVDGVAAATILGDGRVALILDIDALATRRFTPEPIEPRVGAMV